MAENRYQKYTQQTGVYTDPYREGEEQRKENKEARDARSADRADATAERAANNQAEANRIANARLTADLLKEGKQLDAAGHVVPIPGWSPPLTPEKRAEATGQYSSLGNLLAGVTKLRQQYDANFKGMDAKEYLPGALRPANAVFDDTAGALSAYVAAALGLSGQQFNTPAEQKLFIGSILPHSNDTDAQIVNKLDWLDNLVKQAQAKGRGQLGYTDENDPLRGTAGYDDFINRTGGGGGDGGPSPSAAPGGSTSQQMRLPPEMRAEHAAWMRENGRNLDPDAYVRFRQGLDTKYSYGSDSEANRKWAEDVRRGVQQGASVPTGIETPNTSLQGFDKLRNDAVNNPFGAFAASMGNAGGFGIPSLLAGDQMDALRFAQPGGSIAGEIAGGITGTMIGAGGLRAASGAVANPTVASLLANPITADVAYGSIYGGTQADDPLYGVVGGGLSAFVGNRAGNWVGRRLPWGNRMPEDPLGRGERAVFDAVANTGQDQVVAALSQANDLGVPASIADFSPDVNSLAGAAIRRSPEVAGDARRSLFQRGRGQYDRLIGALSRDLGPIENIPQRSEDLITQARAAAGPLYDAAYAAPGASVIDLSDIMNRPSMARALANARRIAAEEGRDPDALGIVLGPDGAVELRQPSWQTLDYVKRGLDDVLEGYRDPTTGRLVLDTEGRAVNGTLQDFLQRVDTMNPDYAAARAAYAGPAAEREALERGQRAVSLSPDRLELNVNRSTPIQLDQSRLGFQSQLAENAGRLRYSPNPFDATLGTPAMEQRLATLYPEGEGNIARLLLQRDMEGELAASTNRLVGNSFTAERQLADQAFEQQPGVMGTIAQGALETAVTGAPVATSLRAGLGRGFGQAVRDWRTLGVGRRARELAGEIGPVALDIDTQRAIDSLASMGQRDAAYRALLEEALDRAATRGGHGVSGASSAVASALMRQ